MADKSQWFRVSTRITDSKKIHALSDSQFRWLILFWAEARKNDGILPPVDDMEFHLRKTSARIQRAIQELKDKRFIEEIDGHLVPHDWDEHQWEETSSTERVRRHRERKRNVPETLHETRTERDVTSLREEHSRVTEQRTEQTEQIRRAPAIADETFAQFEAAYREAKPDVMPDDFSEALFPWRLLSFEQQILAVQGVRRRVEYGIWRPGEPHFITPPAKYLKSEWKREVLPPVKKISERERKVQAWLAE